MEGWACPAFAFLGNHNPSLTHGLPHNIPVSSSHTVQVSRALLTLLAKPPSQFSLQHPQPAPATRSDFPSHFQNRFTTHPMSHQAPPPGACAPCPTSLWLAATPAYSGMVTNLVLYVHPVPPEPSAIMLPKPACSREITSALSVSGSSTTTWGTWRRMSCTSSRWSP